MVQDNAGIYFAFFNEIGIIDQLATTALEKALPAGMVATQFQVLNHLIRVGDGRTPLAMARAFQVPKTSMTHNVAGLVKRGYIEVRPNPKDGRSKQVWITDPGRAVREAAIAALAPEFSKMLAGVDPAAMRSAIPLLTRIREIMDAARDGED